MTAIVDCETLRKLLSVVSLPAFLSGLAQTIEEHFRRWAEIKTMPRIATHFARGVIELMPASDGEGYAFKYVSGHPANTAQGLLTVTGLGVLADTATGYPVLVSEMTILTALRTAATSAVAARYMATPGSTTMGLIGTGAQAEFQTLAFAYLMGVKAIRYFDVDPYAMEKFEHNLRDTPLTLIRCSSPEETIDGVRLITTATAAKRHQVLFPGVLVSAGAHLNAIGGDCPGKTELDPTLLSRARTVVEYLPQSRIEGEIQQCRDSGHVVELWEVVSGIKPGRVSDDEITIFDSVGFALEDFATLRYVQRMCQETGISVSCPLVPKPRDPRNLFGYIFGNSFSERHPT